MARRPPRHPLVLILAAFLTALHQPASAAADGRDRGGALADRAEGFARGPHRGRRSGPDSRPGAVRAIWDDAVTAPAWDGPPLWLHGDLHPANVLTADGTLCGVDRLRRADRFGRAERLLAAAGCDWPVRQLVRE